MTIKNHHWSVIVTGGAAASVYLALIAITVIEATGVSFRDGLPGLAGAGPARAVAVNESSPQPTSSPSPSAPTAPSPTAASSANGQGGSVAGAQTKLSDAALLAKMRGVPQGVWAVDGTPQQAARQARAVAAGSLETLIVYNLPGRDCGSYSAGGASDDVAYRAYVDGLASGIGGRAVRAVIEPDALGQCSTPERIALVRYAATTLQGAGARVYIDASMWVDSDFMASLLRDAGIAGVTGFSLNVSGFQTTASAISYGRRVSAATGGKHFIIDTSRNGNGPKGEEWCNPSGRAVGIMPTLATGQTLVDGYLWLKNPGESDGECTEFGHRDPPAGVWWPAYALALGRNAGW